MKKLFLTLVMLVALSCVLAFAVSAESVHEGRVDLDATVTLNDGSVCSLFDSEGNALIWYKDLNGSLASIRADDSRVKYIAATWTVNINGITGPEMIGVRIDLEEGSISSILANRVRTMNRWQIVCDWKTRSARWAERSA